MATRSSTTRSGTLHVVTLHSVTLRSVRKPGDAGCPPLPRSTGRRAGWVALVGVVSLAALGGIGCDGGASGAGRMRPPTPVVVSSPFEHEFADRVEAIGTAYANESVVITARVTKQVDRVLFEDGQSVRAGETLVELESTEETAQLAQARAAQADAKLRFDRVADLARSGTESRSRYDEVRTALDAANARVEEIQARIADLRIRAPFAGVLGLREVSPGTLVKPGDRITTLDDIDRIKLDFSVPRPSSAGRACSRSGRDRGVPGADLRRTGRRRRQPRRSGHARAIRVRAEIDNPDHALRPGLLLSLELRANPERCSRWPSRRWSRSARASSSSCWTRTTSRSASRSRSGAACRGSSRSARASRRTPAS
ncbi:MAG: efflux RND transporter periplasmic adaptor subunit [Myxococcota bacterium]